MTRALVTQLVEALEYAFTGNRRPEILGAAITAARAYLETEPSGERAELIARLAKQWAELDPADPYRADVGQAVNMLEADAQQAKPTDENTVEYWRAYSESQRESFDLMMIELKALRAPQAKRVPMTPQEIRDWWASENKLEDCDMCKLHDFETVVRAVERRHNITQADKPTDWSAA